jgi:hypothetical protein
MKPSLAELGFKKRAGGVFTVELPGEVLGWLGLNRASKHLPPGELEINPVVGVRHQRVERVVAELRSERFHAYVPPTFSSPIGYLMPQARYRAWVLPASGGGDSTTEMSAAIAAYGLPFMRSAADLGELCRLLESGHGHEHQMLYRRPVAWLLAGDREKASRIIDEELTKVGDRGDAAALDFRRFARALRIRITSS